MRPPLCGLACVMLGAVAMTPAPAAGSCRHMLSPADADSFHKELHVTDAAKGLPLTTATGELSVEDENSLVPTFNSACGSHVAASLADDRVRIEIAGPSSGLGLQETAADTRTGIDGYANLAADLTGPASPLAFTFEASFLSNSENATGQDRRYFAGRSWIGFFDQRAEASAEVAMSLDSGEGGTGLATKYEISADLWQTDGFSLSSFAGFTFADPDYEDDDSDAIADRLVREIGASMTWGRMNLSLVNSLATDNVDGNDDRASNRWTTWNAQVGLDLSDLHRVVPNSLSVGFEIERFEEQAGRGLAEDAARGLSRAVDLGLSWNHHGGTTNLGLSQSMAWEQSTAADRTDQSRFEIGLGRSIEADGWGLSAAGVFSQELVSEFQETHLYRSLSFDLGLDMDPSPDESLGFEAGLAFDEGSEGSSLSFGDASVLFTYDLRF